MSQTRTPDPQTVYRDAQGRVLMYVRTEDRPGRGGPEHLFVTTRERAVFHHWSSEVPPDCELILDVEGRKQAEDLKWQLAASDHEREIMVGLLKRACLMLPRSQADELRRAFRESRP